MRVACSYRFALGEASCERGGGNGVEGHGVSSLAESQRLVVLVEVIDAEVAELRAGGGV